jgi:hypothetical protein
MTASWYHCSVKPISRSAGRSVVAAAAYRLGDALHDEISVETHDYTRRSGVASSFTIAPANAPAWALDPERLWNAVERAEKRINSTLAREVELALPAAVSAEARMGIAQEFAAELVARYGVAVSAAIHKPDRNGDQRNHHAHILFTTRRFEADGLGAKTRVLDDRKTGPAEVIHLRRIAADLINSALEDAGLDDRVDHRSFAARGIDQEPTSHLGPSAAGKERRGERSDRGDVNREIADHNRDLNALVQQLTELDAEIAAAEEHALDTRYGVAESAPAQLTLVVDNLQIDTFGAVHRETISQVQLEAVAAPPEPDTPAGDGFMDVHRQTISQARADAAVIASEEASTPGTRFERIRTWWSNMREHFAEWRDHLLEHLGLDPAAATSDHERER